MARNDERPAGAVSRRGFGRTVAAAAAAGLAPVTAAAQQPRQESGLAPEDEQEVDAKLANMLRKYGDRLNEEQKTRARGILVRHQRMLAKVRAFALENGDCPATMLKVERGGK
jgi:hypothetical protein